MIEALFKYRFLQYALASGVLASVVCGIIGVIIVEKKLVMMSGGIAHTSYGGVGLGYLLGFEPIIGAFIFSLLASFGVGYIKRKGGERSDVVISLFWSLGMALGILFIALMPGYPPDLSSYLFGNILSVTKVDLRLITCITAVVTVAVASLYNNWKAYIFDEEFAAVIGLKTAFFEYLLLILISMTVVALIRVVGIILALALLTAPAATAAIFTGDFRKRIIYAIIIGCVLCVAGLWISFELNIASGATIVLLSGICYLLACAGSYVCKELKRKKLLSGRAKA